MEKELNADGLLKILEDREGVSGYVVFNYEGIPMRYTMEHEKAVQYAALISDFLGVTKKIINKELMKDQNPAENEIEFIRMRTKHLTELIITSYSEYTICCIQNCNPVPPPDVDDPNAVVEGGVEQTKE